MYIFILCKTICLLVPVVDKVDLNPITKLECIDHDKLSGPSFHLRSLLYMPHVHACPHVIFSINLAGVSFGLVRDCQELVLPGGDKEGGGSQGSWRWWV